MSLISPKSITITTQDGSEKSYLISKFPAVQGREIVAKYPLSSLPKLGDYEINEQTMLKLMKFVAVERDGVEIKLENKSLVDNHVPDWETLAKIEMAMIEYNCSFFANGRASTFLEGIAQKAKSLTTKTLMDLLGQLSQKDTPASTN